MKRYNLIVMSNKLVEVERSNGEWIKYSETQWRDASKKKPEKKGLYLIQLNFGDIRFRKTTLIWFGDHWGNFDNENIEAWMPLPPDFKKEV